MIKNLLKIGLLSLPILGFSQIFQENWDGNGQGINAWTIIDGDGQTVDSDIVNLFPTAWSILGNTNINTLTSNAIASTSWYDPAGTANDWLISPTIPVSGTSPTLYWSAKAQDAAYPDGYKVMLAPNGGNTIADFTVTLFSTNSETSSWSNRYADLTPYIGQNVRIAFVNQSTDMYIILIDDIKVEETFTTPPISYCGPLYFGLSFFGITIDGDEPITSVNFAGINNTSSEVTGVGNSHEFFTSQSANVTAGQTYTMTIQGNTGGPYDSNIVAFFDWNQNGILNDPGEVYQFTNILSNSSGVDGINVTHDIVVPTTALPGSTRMRIKKMYGTNNLLDPCQGEQYGQAEDYSVNVTNLLATSEQVANSYKISIYPNPASDIVNISSPSPIRTINLFDTSGKMLDVKTINKDKTKLDISKLPSGTYLISIETKDSTSTSKIIKK